MARSKNFRYVSALKVGDKFSFNGTTRRSYVITKINKIRNGFQLSYEGYLNKRWSSFVLDFRANDMLYYRGHIE